VPVRFSVLKRALELQGVQVLPHDSGGSHWKARKDGRTYPIPAHNGTKTEIGDMYVRGVCRALGLDERMLRKGF
jgi:hypothetical protein